MTGYSNRLWAALRVCVVALALLAHGAAAAHSSWKLHAEDMYAVFGFEESAELTEWMRHISSDMIDGYNKEKIYDAGEQKVGFYDYLKYKFPQFKCKHRVLFHWGYNSRPWNDELQQKVEQYGWNDSIVAQFQMVLVDEQARRNRIANELTENLFGFAHGGKEAAKARALVSIAYDVHLLGDYTPDNKDFDGLCSFKSVVGDLINNLRELDYANTKALVADIQRLSRADVDDHQKAVQMLDLLKDKLPAALKNHADSRISKRVK